VIGVSADDHKTQCDFAESVKASFPMIGDPKGAITKKYGVLWPLIGKPRRITYIIDKGRTIRAVIDHELQIGKHLEETLAVLRSLS
jgi:alkyl hydroperoxide reductase subunit AhpC